MRKDGTDSLQPRLFLLRQAVRPAFRSPSEKNVKSHCFLSAEPRPSRFQRGRFPSASRLPAPFEGIPLAAPIAAAHAAPRQTLLSAQPERAAPVTSPARLRHFPDHSPARQSLRSVLRRAAQHLLYPQRVCGIFPIIRPRGGLSPARSCEEPCSTCHIPSTDAAVFQSTCSRSSS